MSALATADRVIIRRVRAARYPRFPYDPPERYPEFAQLDGGIDPDNQVYAAVRAVLADLRLDQDNLGSRRWNPLGRLIAPGQRALLKPNWVLHANQSGVEEIESLVTHTSVVRPVIDYVLRALDGRGTIDVADAPLQNCDFAQLVRRTMIDELLDRYRRRFPQVRFAVVDLRKTILHRRRARDRRAQQSGDPRGYTLIDVGQQSLLTEIEHRYRRFRVANYDHRMMAAHHNRQRHEYLVANSVLSADFIINLPKLKCHIKAGITGALKNLVGINGHKEFLPHHVNGCPETGGDQYPAYSRILPLANRVYDDYWARLGERGRVRNLSQELAVRVLRKGARVLEHAAMFDGGWSGNDTIPRTTLDLNHVLYFYDVAVGTWSPAPVRTVLHIVDGVIGGEGYGPLRPTRKAAGVVLGGWNPLTVDICGARLIGFDPAKVRLLRYAMTHAQSRLASVPMAPSEVRVLDHGESTSADRVHSLGFSIPRGWEAAAQ